MLDVTGSGSQESLNPFEFRAGIYFIIFFTDEMKLDVLIPLNSGLVFTSGELKESMMRFES